MFAFTGQFPGLRQRFVQRILNGHFAFVKEVAWYYVEERCLKMNLLDLLDMIKIHWKQLSKYRFFNKYEHLTDKIPSARIERKLSRNYLWNYHWELQFSVF